MNLTSFILILTLIIGAADPDQRDWVGLDIYNRDQAMVRELRRVDLAGGINLVDFHRISDAIYGHTASIRPMEKETHLTTALLSFNYDLVSHEKMLTRYLGRWFSFTADDIIYEGRLLKFDETSLFLQPDTLDPLLMVVDRGKLTEMYYPSMPEGLFLEPTLRWGVEADRKLKGLPVELSYITSDVSWTCDYRAELMGNDSLELSGFFTIYNELPLDFPQAEVVLVAGGTHRSEDPENWGGDTGQKSEIRNPKSEIGGRMFEYYRYPLDRPIDLRGNQTIQTPFFPSQQIKVERRFVFPHLLDDRQVRVELRFDNSEAAGAGRPLPEGDVGLYRRSAEGQLSFIGEDHLPATPPGAGVELDVGAAFDLTARRTRIAQARPERNRHQETWRVELTSSRNGPATVHVEQRVFGYYKVENATANGQPVEFTSEAANRIVFPVNVPPGGKTTLTFTLVYGY